MKLKKTSKLFFDKYALKVAVNTILANTFRDNRLDNVESTIALYDERFRNSKTAYVPHHLWAGRRVNKFDLAVLKVVYKHLKTAKDYTLRIESSCINIYSNDETLIDTISKEAEHFVYYVSKPATTEIKDYLLNNKFKIIANGKPEYQFKVTVNPLRDEVDGFIDWAKQMPDKIKLLSPPKWTEGYFYAVDQKVVTLCRLFLGSKIRRVDEMIHVSEI